MDIPEPIQDLQNLRIHRKRRIWQPFMEKYDCQVICEIGVLSGHNFVRMIGHNPQVAVAVDSWVEDGIKGHNDSAYTQDQKDLQYEQFKELVADKPFVQIYRKYSFDAARHFPDEYFDLIYLDADHSYEGCKKDLELWYPKVKTGRFFTGDDYREGWIKWVDMDIGVIPAVNEFFAEHGKQVYEIPRLGWAVMK